MAITKYSHGTHSGLQVKVIQSQHCIEVEGVQIELMYLFGENGMRVYIEDKLVLSTQIRVNKTMINYTNLIEVATKYFEQERDKERKRLKEEDNELRRDLTPEEKKGLSQYVIESITTIIE